MTFDEFLEEVKKDGNALAYLSDASQTPEVCLEAVMRRGCALQYVVHRTPELCLASVQQNGWALEFV